MKDHLLSGATLCVIETGERSFTPPVALLEQRQSDEQGCRRSSKLHANGDVAIGRECPFERRPHIANVRSVFRKVLLPEPRLNNLVVLEKLGKKGRVSSGDAIRFRLGELSSSIAARGVEQPIIGGSVYWDRGYQRFRKQAVERNCNTRIFCLSLRCKKAGGLQREIPNEDREPPENAPLTLRKQIVTPVEH